MKREEWKRNKAIWTDKVFFLKQSMKFIAKGHWDQEMSGLKSELSRIWVPIATTSDLEKDSPEKNKWNQTKDSIIRLFFPG